MGGIGKTTLAKEVYNGASVQFYFDVRAWATIFQQHNVKEISLSLLRSTKGDKFYMDDEAELADMLQKSLKGKRYLIVLDDMWKSEAWDDLRLCFPCENNGSRILLTTHNTEVACSAGTENLSVQMSLMDLDESSNLFESIAFANEALPSVFETIGKQIVDKCHGLPLTIVTVAGLLKSKRTVKYWANVAEDVKSITNDPDKQCLDVLGLSYNHSTSDLKACLLYFGIFREDSEISVKRLASLWMAEGFLKLENDLEGEANKCLQELVDRCLVIVIKRSVDETKIRSCKVHDLIYELCLRELTQSQDVFVMNDILPKGMCWAEAQSSNHVPPEHCCLGRNEMWPFKRWISYSAGLYRAFLTPRYHHLIRGETNDDDYNLLNRTHSIFSWSFFSSGFNLESELLHFKLLRILDLTQTNFRFFPREILYLIWLRYLSMSGSFCIPPEISNLCNLQTFITEIEYTQKFPQQIWRLMKLWHLEPGAIDLPNPPRLDEERYFVLSNLHIFLACLQLVAQRRLFLEVLKQKRDACCGEEWHPIEGGFSQLKTLQIVHNDLKYWKATNDNFPVLECLMIKSCYNLEEIPIEFAEINSLQLIKLEPPFYSRMMVHI